MSKDENQLALYLEPKSGLPAELEEELKANLEGVEFSFPQIKILHQETQKFQMPDDTVVSSFEGILLDTNRINAYWKISYDESGGGTPPDCFSLDGVTPAEGCERQSDRCVTCPLGGKDSFGSEVKKDGSRGRGKACKNMKRLHIMLAGHQEPFRLTLPPSNLKVIDQWIQGMTTAGYSFRYWVTKFSLHKDHSQDGVAYSKIRLERQFEIADTPEKKTQMRELWNKWKPDMREQAILFNEYQGADDFEKE